MLTNILSIKRVKKYTCNAKNKLNVSPILAYITDEYNNKCGFDLMFLFFQDFPIQHNLTHLEKKNKTLWKPGWKLKVIH